MTPFIREMRIEDIPATLALRLSTRENQVTLEELETDYGVTPSSMAASLNKSAKGWLCELDGQVAGFAMGDSANGEVTVVAVGPSHEGLGIGKSLLERIVNWLSDCGHEEIWLLANPDPNVRATGFYRKLGWHRTGRMQGEDEILTLARP